MIGKIVDWFLANWETISAIIGLIAAAVAAWRRGTKK